MSYLLAIQNGTPGVYALGTDDQSTRTQPTMPDVLPTHLPKIWIYAQKGPATPQLVVGGSRLNMYGVDSFDPRGKYFNHQTAASNIINAPGNAQMIQRIEPEDSKTASLRIWLDVLETEIALYERNADGTFVLDVDGFRVPTGVTTNGVVARWVATAIPNDISGDSAFGIGTITAGDMEDTAAGTQSVMFPMFDMEVPDFGEYGNHNGIRFWTPTLKSRSPVDDRLLKNKKVYPFRIGCMRRTDYRTTPRAVTTRDGAQYMDVCLKPETLGFADEQLYVGDNFTQRYNELDNRALPPTFGPFKTLHVYDEYIKTVLGLVYDLEKPHINTDFHDITPYGGDEEHYLINLFGGMSSRGVPYYAFDLRYDGINVIRPSENSAILAQGGLDGTMNDQLFSEAVSLAVSGYADETNRLQDPVINPESIIYDTGFTLQTKYDLLKALTYRKDIAVILSTHDITGVKLTANQESSLAIALRTRAQSYPESDYFGTHVMRCMIVGRSGKMINSQYTKRVPLTFEIADKSAKYMGAGNGRWKPGKSFGSAPLNEVMLLTDLNETFTPYSVRNKDWSNGLVWCESFKLRTAFIPALKTVYDDDTSVLNSFFTMMACVELQKVGHRAWRQFTGTDNMTDEEFAKAVDKFIVANTIGRFDDRFVIVPKTYYTENDKANGYSWHTKITIYAGNMKTVATISLESRRISDLTDAGVLVDRIVR